MTPNDIVGMALLNGLDMIAVTDHNTLGNTESVLKAARRNDLIALPGTEVSTAEDVHVLCLFDSMDKAMGFESELQQYYSAISNRKDIFGNQLLFNENDAVTGELDRMLIAATSISFDDLYYLVNKHNGAFIPAHIDRDSFSVLSNLGFLPPHLDIHTLEVSAFGIENGFLEQNSGSYPNNRFVFSSDAHHLWDIADKKHFLMLPERSAEAAIEFLR